MSISNTNRVAGPFTGTGVIAPYPFTFKVFQATDVVATITDLAGVESPWVLTTNYTLVLNADQDVSPGGTLTPVAALPTGYLLTLTSAVANLQPVVLTNAGAFLPAVINTALDRLTILVQQLATKLSRAITFPISDGAITTQLPTKTVRALKVPYFLVDGSVGVSNLTLAQIESITSAGGNANLFYSATSGGTGDAITGVAGISAYAVGQTFRIFMPAGNTVANPTINFDGKGAKTIKRTISGGKVALIGANEYITGYMAWLVYDGTDMILVNPLITYGSALAMVGTGSDLTGTDTVNIYNQIDAYNPNSAIGAVGASTVPGISASTSRGTGIAPSNNSSGDLIGGVTMYGYIAGAYSAAAALVARVFGSTPGNLGGQLELYTKADNGALALRGTMSNAGVLDLTNRPTVNSIPVGMQISSITASVASNALTATINPGMLDFRSATLTSGAINARYLVAAASLVVASGATLGTVSGVASRLALLALDNAGTIEAAIVNISGGVNLNEEGVISTTALSGASNAANVIYSTTARTNVPYRVVGYIDSTQVTAGTWATAPSLITGAGGNVADSMSSIGYGQTVQTVTRNFGTTYYNTTGKPIFLSIIAAAAGAGGSGVQISINGAAAFTFCYTNSGGVGQLIPGQFLIPAGVSYALTGVNANANVAYELR